MVKVQLYLYDLSQGMARQMSPMLLGRQIDGIWHSGIVVFGHEYFYGGGIQMSRPGCTVAGRPVQIFDLGETTVTQMRLTEFLREISHRFTAETYNLLRHNCNNFANEVAIFLTGKPIPSFITGLPDEVISTPLGMSLVPLIEQFESQMRANGGGVVPWQEPPPASASASILNPHAASSAAPKSPPGHAASPKRLVRPDLFPELKLRHISVSSAPLTSVDKDAAKFFTQLKSQPLLTDSDRSILDALVQQLQSTSPEPTLDCLPVFKRLVSEIPIAKAFSALALFRLALSVRKLAKAILQSHTQVIFTMVHRFVDDPGASMPVQLMALCCLSNVLSHGCLAHNLALDRRIIESMSNALRSREKTTRLMAATVMYNCALQLHFESDDAQDRDDISIQMISGLHECLNSETDGATKFRILQALGHTIYFMGTEGIMLLSALEFDHKQFSEPTNVAEIAIDIHALISSHI